MHIISGVALGDAKVKAPTRRLQSDKFELCEIQEDRSVKRNREGGVAGATGNAARGSGQQGGQAGPGTTAQIGKTGGPADQANKMGIAGH